MDDLEIDFKALSIWLGILVAVYAFLSWSSMQENEQLRKRELIEIEKAKYRVAYNDGYRECQLKMLSTQNRVEQKS